MVQKIEVKNKSKNHVSTGANTEIYIDGQLAKGVKSFKYEDNAGGVGVVTIEYYADVQIESNIDEIVTNAVMLGEE